jgi:hypothetical protein
MCTKSLKYQHSEIVSNVRLSQGVRDALRIFGGMDVVDSGNFHQFSPVKNLMGALYCDRPDMDDSYSKLSCNYFQQYDTVVCQGFTKSHSGRVQMDSGRRDLKNILIAIPPQTTSDPSWEASAW